MDKKIIIGLIASTAVVLIISVVAVSVFVDNISKTDDIDNELKLYENKYISFKYPKSFNDPVELTSSEFYKVSIYNSEKYESLDVDVESKRDLTIDQLYETLNFSSSIEKNMSIEKVDFKGKTAILKITEYSDNAYKYQLIFTFMDVDKLYTLYLFGNDLQSLKSTYETYKSSVVVKEPFL